MTLTYMFSFFKKIEKDEFSGLKPWISMTKTLEKNVQSQNFVPSFMSDLFLFPAYKLLLCVA